MKKDIPLNEFSNICDMGGGNENYHSTPKRRFKMSFQMYQDIGLIQLLLSEESKRKIRDMEKLLKIMIKLFQFWNLVEKTHLKFKS